MYVFYIDSFLLYHSIITICIIQFIQKTAGIKISVRRSLTGLAGTTTILGMLAAHKLFTYRGLWESCYCLLHVFMMIYLFRIKNMRTFLQIAFLYLIAACFMRGVMGVAMTYIQASGSPAFITSILFVLLGNMGLRVCRAFWETLQLAGNREKKVMLKNKNCEILVEALYDTGNSLADIFTGEPVHIISKKTACKLGIDVEDADKVLRDGGHLVPYRTINQKSGLMIVFRIDTMEIYSGKQKKKLEKPLLGIGNGLTGDADIPLILNCRTLQTACLNHVK